ncbi:hypothetical protein GCM10027600_12140 [Nocardioides ginsengisegetis]
MAASAALAAALAGALAGGTPAEAHHGSDGTTGKPMPTNFGFKGDVFGVKLLLENVEQRSVKDAYAQQRCTRYAGREVVKSSTAAVPDNPLINVSATTSRTRTYRDADTGTYGVRGSSAISDVEIGGDVGGQQTPTISIKGFTTSSDAFHSAKGFGHREALDFASFQIAHLSDSVPVPPELQDLLDAIDSTTGDVVGQVIDVLQSANTPIEIPGLGSISLGTNKGSTGSHFAISESYALKINVDANGQNQTLQLGRARTRIGSPTPGGVFRSIAMGMDAYALNNTLHLGNIQQRSIPCEGTGGKVKHQHVDSASLALGVIVNLTGIDYRFKGDQNADGTASGFTSSHIDKVEIPAVNLELDDVNGKVAVDHRHRTGAVGRTITFSVGKILVNGEEQPVPAPGKSLTFQGGVIETRIVKSNFYGSEVHAVRVTLTDFDSVLDFGWAAAHVFPR